MAWHDSNVCCPTIGGDPTKFSTKGLVSTWMADCLQVGKPSQFEAGQLGRLSLLPSVGW